MNIKNFFRGLYELNYNFNRMNNIRTSAKARRH